MWETSLAMKPCLLAVLLPLLAGGCAASADDRSTSEESNLDTSGCSGLDASEKQGALTVSTSRPPTASCWNIDDSGLTVSYAWTQKTSDPGERSIGFYVALNGADGFQKASSTECRAQTSGGLGHDTSGDRSFGCTASRRFTFRDRPELKAAAYGADGRRLGWNVQVAVALDDDGNWDSLNGANYRFSF